MKNLELALQLVTEPTAFFEELKKTPRFWFPLLTLTISSALVMAWYYSIVDFDWMRDHLISGNPGLEKMSAADRAKAASFMSKNVMMWSALIGIVVMVPAIRFLEALYYLLVGNFTKIECTIKQWFALACWSGFPMIITVVPMALIILMRANGQIGPESLSLLSLNELIFHFPLGHKFQSLMSALTILHPWVWWLTIVGVRVMSGRSTMFSTVIVMAPLIIIYGAWAGFAALF